MLRALLCPSLTARSASPLGHNPCIQASRRALQSGPAALALAGCTFSTLHEQEACQGKRGI